MADYKTVEGELGAVNVLTNLTTFGTETTGPVKVPSNCSRIVEIWAAVGAINDTAGDNCGIVLRLSGKGVVNGPHDFAVFGTGTNAATIASTLMWTMAQKYSVDVQCVPNEDINVACAPVGDDVLIATVMITLVFA